MSEFPERAEDHSNTFVIAMVGGVASILLWAAVVALLAYYERTGGQLKKVRDIQGQSNNLRNARAEQQNQLRDYRWLDQSKGVVKLPIERAMALVVSDHAANKPSLVPAVGPHDIPTVTPKGAVPGATPAEMQPVKVPSEATTPPLAKPGKPGASGNIAGSPQATTETQSDLATAPPNNAPATQPSSPP